MNVRESDELISALHDGELSAEERAAAERLLDESAPARETLSDFADLSETLRSAPPISAPGDLQTSVLQRIRADAAGLAATRLAPTRLANQRGARSRRGTSRIFRAPRWLAAKRGGWWIGIVAGCLIVAVAGWRLRPEPAQPHNRTETLYALRLNETEGRAMNERETVGAPASPTSLDSAADDFSLEGAPTSAAAPAQSVGAPALAASRGMARTTSPDDSILESNVPKSDADTVRNLIAGNGHPPRPGELLSYLQTVEEQVVLIEFRVVDVQEAAGQFQVLLAENGIHPLDQAPARQRELGISGDYVAIYVEAPAAQLVSALGDVDLTSLRTMDVDGTQVADPKQLREIVRQRVDETPALPEQLRYRDSKLSTIAAAAADSSAASAAGFQLREPLPTDYVAQVAQRKQKQETAKAAGRQITPQITPRKSGEAVSRVRLLFILQSDKNARKRS